MSYMGDDIVPAENNVRERRTTLGRARMSIEALPEQDIIIRNISCSGIGARSLEIAPKEGQPITISLADGFEICGVVSWVKGQSFGMSLDHRFALEELEDIMRRQKQFNSATTDWEVKRMHRVADQSIVPSQLRRI